MISDRSSVISHQSSPITDHRSPITGSNPRRGVALLIVLGLLGLLLISAVGFAVLMRTERSAATNYRHTSSARHLLFAALNGAIDDIDADIGDDLNPKWEGALFVPERGRRLVREPEGVLFSCYDSEIGSPPVFARILTKDVMTYVPAVFHRRLTDLSTKLAVETLPSSLYSKSYNDGRWITRRRFTQEEEDQLTHTREEASCHPEWIPINHNGSIIGRYAFAAIDSSGLLDASLVSEKGVKRWMGGSMGEVRLDPDILTVKDLKNVAQFENDRAAHGRYETIAELASLNSGIDNTKLSNFEVFSTFSTNQAPGDVVVNLFGLDSAAKVNARKEEIRNAFTASGFANLNALVPLCTARLFEHLLFPGLIDYVDTDSVMEDRFTRPCTEKLPLANSFGIEMTGYMRKEIPATPTSPVPLYEHTVTHRVFLNIADWALAGSKAADGPFTVRGAIRIENNFAGASGTGTDPNTGLNVEVYDYKISPTRDKYEKVFAFEFPFFPNSSSGGETDILEPIGTVKMTSAQIPEQRAPKFYFTAYVAVEVYNKFNEMCYHFPGTGAGVKKADQFKGGLPGDSFQDREGWAILEISADFQSSDDQVFWAECVDPRFAFEYPGEGNKPQWYANRAGVGPTPLSSLEPYGPVPATYKESTSLQRTLHNKPELAEHLGLTVTSIDGFHDPRFGNDGNDYDDYRKQRQMCVANAPLQSPGELGYLLCGPWETVRLYDRWPNLNTSNHHDVPAAAPDAAYNSMNDHHTVLDHFEVRDPTAEPKGKVNLNRASEDVLSLLFLDMPLRTERSSLMANPSPGNLATVVKGNAPNYLPQVLGKKLATELQRKVADTGKPIDNLSDLAYIYANLNDPPALNPMNVVLDRCTAATGDKRCGEFEREAVIRNVCNLLTTRQQLFTIILRADAFTTRFGSDKLADGTVLSSANAVAQVFRDPVKTKDADGHEYHKTTVRMLKILE